MKKKKSRIFINLKCSICLKNNLKSKTPNFHEQNKIFFSKLIKIQKKKINSGISIYTTTKNRLNTTNKLELNKFCCFCKKHTLHKEIK